MSLIIYCPAYLNQDHFSAVTLRNNPRNVSSLYEESPYRTLPQPHHPGQPNAPLLLYSQRPHPDPPTPPSNTCPSPTPPSWTYLSITPPRHQHPSPPPIHAWELPLPSSSHPIDSNGCLGLLAGGITTNYYHNPTIIPYRNPSAGEVSQAADNRATVNSFGDGLVDNLLKRSCCVVGRNCRRAYRYGTTTDVNPHKYPTFSDPYD